MGSVARQELENWLKQQNIIAKRVADVGGSQLPVRKRVKRWHVEECDILDLPDYDLNSRTYPSQFEFKAGCYDTVFCLEVSEYLWNPVGALELLHLILKEGGLLYMSFHFIYPHHDPKETDYLRYTRWGVEKLLKETGFMLEEITPRKFKTDAPTSLYFAEGMKALDKGRDKIHREQGHMIIAKKI